MHACLSPCMRLHALAHLAPHADEIREVDIGTGAGLFEVRKVGDEFWTCIVDCKVGGWEGGWGGVGGRWVGVRV